MRLRKMSVVDPGCLMRLRAMPDAVPGMPAAAEPCPASGLQKVRGANQPCRNRGQVQFRGCLPPQKPAPPPSAGGPRSGPTMLNRG